jgi:hypothetical protein
MLTENKKKMLESYNKGLALYKAMKFEEALGQFRKALGYEPEDGPTKLYVARCAEYSKTPPSPDWDGVYEMKTK